MGPFKKFLSQLTKYNVVKQSKFVPLDKLSSHILAMHKITTGIKTKIGLGSAASVGFVGMWASISEFAILSDLSGLCILGLGLSLPYSHFQYNQYHRMQKYTKLSFTSGKLQLTNDRYLEDTLKEIYQWKAVHFKIKRQGLMIEGINTGEPIHVVPHPRVEHKIKNQELIILPHACLNTEAQNMVGLLYESWFYRFIAPFSLAETMLHFSIGEISLDDHLCALGTLYIFYMIIRTEPTDSYRFDLNMLLLKGQCPKEVLTYLIAKEHLDNGCMAFLDLWLKNKRQIGIKMARSGAMELYDVENKPLSFLGPFRLHTYPNEQSHRYKAKTNTDIPTADYSQSPSTKLKNKQI